MQQAYLRKNENVDQKKYIGHDIHPPNTLIYYSYIVTTQWKTERNSEGAAFEKFWNNDDDNDNDDTFATIDIPGRCLRGVSAAACSSE